MVSLGIELIDDFEIHAIFFGVEFTPCEIHEVFAWSILYAPCDCDAVDSSHVATRLDVTRLINTKVQTFSRRVVEALEISPFDVSKLFSPEIAAF